MAESADSSLPAFIAVPKGAPAYHGFPILENAEKDGFAFGVITEPKGEPPASWGDAFVVAPDGSRAGIVWQAEGEPSPVVCLPSPGRWGVYAFRFQHPVRNEQDLIENLHEVLPQLKAFYAAALVEHPESTNAHLQAEAFERRKVEIFRDGSYDFAQGAEETHRTRLASEPIPSLAEIGSDPQFEPTEISQEEFEDVWTKARVIGQFPSNPHTS